MKIIYEKNAIKYLKSMPPFLRDPIRAAISDLTLTPPRGDIKPLKGYKDGRMRLRIGKYRVIYRYEDDGAIAIIRVMDVGSRGDIYK